MCILCYILRKTYRQNKVETEEKNEIKKNDIRYVFI
jgi:hypothetical protein